MEQHYNYVVSLHIPSDVDECSLLNGGCHHDCSNTIGGFHCSCYEGYTISTDKRTCQGTTTHITFSYALV